MKKLTLSLMISLIICLIISVVSNASQVENMTQKLIRVHIIANSDSEADQALKLAVRDSLSLIMSELLSNVTSKAQALNILSQNLSAIEADASATVSACGYTYPVSAALGKQTFPVRHYEDFTLPAGEYDSLCLTVGSGQGRNFWCVLYPSLCIGSVICIDDTDTFTDEEIIILKEPQKVRYKLLCFELWQMLAALFK